MEAWVAARSLVMRQRLKHFQVLKMSIDSLDGINQRLSAWW